MSAPGEPGRPFVTGGSGFVGGGLLRQLVADGRRPVALARSEASATALRALGAEVVMGDLLDAEGLRAGMRGCAVVFHAAGLNAFCVPAADLRRANVLGSLNVVKAASEAGAARVVYTSSAATLGEERGVVGDEDSEHRGWFLSEYERSKFEAERRVMELAGRIGVDLVSVNPSSVQGPGRAAGTAKLLLDYVNGRLKVFVRTRISFVDARDSVAGHLLAEKRGRPGRRYLLNGATLPSDQLLELIQGAVGVARPVVWLPGWLALAGGSLAGRAAALAGRRPPVCREMVRAILHGHAYDGSRAARELGLAYTPPEVTIARTLDWAIGEGLVTVGPRAGPGVGGSDSV